VDRFRWELGAELPGDRDLMLQSNALQGRKVALLVCGGIAAYRSPDLIRALRRQGAQVQVYVTQEALRFVTRDVLEWCSLSPVIDRLDGRAQHVEDGREIDLYLLAPATYSTINKFALGVADNAVTTTLATALGRLERGLCRIQVAPTMHGAMVNPILRESLARLSDLGVQVIAPRPGAGKANIPQVDSLVAGAVRGLAGLKGGPSLAGKTVLITGGPTPVPIDDVRVLTNRFSGATAVAIAETFHAAGAEVQLLLSGTHLGAPDWIPTRRVSSFDAYRDACLESVADLAIFSAAVADYRLAEPHSGKRPSGSAELNLQLVPTTKVVAAWRSAHARSKLVSFKLEAGLDDTALLEIAGRRLGDHSDLVVANHVEGGDLFLVHPQGHQAVARDQLPGALLDWAVSVL
jgi:phosphopantothenoylcysteine decarboxylase/phosphopantothenate--cysteine ligase